LVRLLEANDDGLRVNAIRALGRIGDPGAAPALHELARASQTPVGVRASAALALAALGDRRAIPILSRIASDPTLGEQLRTIPTASTLTSTSERVVRKRARRMILEMHGVEAIPVLEESLCQVPLRDRLKLRVLIRRLRRK
jgi:HEAT repeat protein